MHKGIILIVKANDKKAALAETAKFLEGYQDTVWDWYVIGGRWTQTLAPMHKEFMEKAKKLFEIERKKKGFLSQQEVSNKQAELQKIWSVNLKAKGENPYCDHYKLPNEGGYYDVLPLADCINIVKEWQQTIKTAQEEEKKAQDWLNGKRGKDNYSMYGYVLKCAAELYQQRFSFETNVYNLETEDFSIPENFEGYFAVMIDIHN